MRSPLITTHTNDAYWTAPDNWTGFLYLDVRADGVWVRVLDHSAWYDTYVLNVTMSWNR
jgi:hypothetical protein